MKRCFQKVVSVVLGASLFALMTVVPLGTAAAHGGWVILGIPPGDGLEPSETIVRGVYQWALRQPTMAAQVREQSPTFETFRARFLERYPVFGVPRVSRTVLREKLPRLGIQTGVTVPPFPEMGTRPAPPPIAVPAPPRPQAPATSVVVAPTPTMRSLEAAMQELRRSLESVSRGQHGATQGVADLRARVEGLEGRLADTARDGKTTTQAVSSLTGHVSTINGRVDAAREESERLRERVDGIERFNAVVVWVLAVMAILVAAGATFLVLRAFRLRPRPLLRRSPAPATPA